MRQKKIVMRRIFPSLFLLVIAVLLVLPQLITGNMVIGSDAIFHFNRFYDTAMQLKEHNFQYFISQYGFQHSARIVNAFYGPLFAYLQGGLVLLAGTWFRYQVLANFCLYLLAGGSMYGLQRKVGIKRWTALLIAVLFMGSFSIQYWIERQGFTSWGAAIMPLCLWPMIKLVKTDRFDFLQVGFCMALMFQVHVFSSFILGLIYAVFFLANFFSSRQKLQLLKKLAGSIGIFLLLTANIWVSLFELYRDNRILAPFVNHTLYLNTITDESWYWLFYPVILPLILLFILWRSIAAWRKFPLRLKLIIELGLVFALLSSNLIPWKWLIQQGDPLAKLVQFPFRFFVPATILFLLAFGLLYQNSSRKIPQQNLILTLLACVSIGQMLFLSSERLQIWDSDQPIMNVDRDIKLNGDVPEIRQAFHQSDLTAALTLVEKATPDYLPVKANITKNKYDLYRHYIIENDQDFLFSVKEGVLQVRWLNAQAGVTAIPVVKYQQTQLRLNGQTIAPRAEDLTELGTLRLKSQQGPNLLEVSYPTSRVFLVAFYSTLIGFIGVSLLLLIRHKKV